MTTQRQVALRYAHGEEVFLGGVEIEYRTRVSFFRTCLPIPQTGMVLAATHTPRTNLAIPST
jgi:hypothetical protein